MHPAQSDLAVARVKRNVQISYTSQPEFLFRIPSHREVLREISTSSGTLSSGCIGNLIRLSVKFLNVMGKIK
jgi:hypothetical protein